MMEGVLEELMFSKILENAHPGYITQLYFSKYGYPMDTSQL